MTGDTVMAKHEEESLAVEIKTFNDLKASLEQNHMGKFVVVKDDKLIGAWDTLDSAASEAVAANIRKNPQTARASSPAQKPCQPDRHC
jgi:hypothetical protein